MLAHFVFLSISFATFLPFTGDLALPFPLGLLGKDVASKFSCDLLLKLYLTSEVSVDLRARLVGVFPVGEGERSGGGLGDRALFFPFRSG